MVGSAYYHSQPLGQSPPNYFNACKPDSQLTDVVQLTLKNDTFDWRPEYVKETLPAVPPRVMNSLLPDSSQSGRTMTSGYSPPFIRFEYQNECPWKPSSAHCSNHGQSYTLDEKLVSKYVYIYKDLGLGMEKYCQICVMKKMTTLVLKSE